MKRIYIIFIFPVLCFIHPLIAQEGDDYATDPQVIYGSLSHVVNTQQNFLDNPVFLNGNLTQQNFPQNEPTVRISRTNSNIVVAAWRDFRLGYNPAVRRIGYSYSTNAGNTWAPAQLLPSPLPNHATQSDPVLTSDNNGYFYLSSTSREATNTRGETVIYRSTNDGVNFNEYSTAAASSSFEDKEWITCDLVPGSPYFNNLYVTWTRIGTGIRFVKSSNGGLNWSSVVNVGDNGNGQGSNVAVGTNFNIYVVWGEDGIKFDKSTNGGTSFGTDFTLSAPNSQIGFPFICVDYSNFASRGNVYVVWDDARNGNNDVWFQRSTNAGVTWLASPVRVNDVTANNQYKAAIQCDITGVLSVIYYDERNGAGQVNSYYAYSMDAGNTWFNQRVSDSSFAYTSIGADVRNGEYIGIDAYQNKIIPVWTDDRSGTPNQEVYTSFLYYISGIGNNHTGMPTEFALKQNYPNPFNPATTIEYSVPKQGHVTLRVFDVLGNEVETLVDGISNAGNFNVSFDASKLSSGIYFYRLQSEGFTNTKKMILVK